MNRLWLLSTFLVILLFTRFYNLENTTRFIWDESSDLVRVHQIYVDKKLTLVGPISEDNSKIFGSLAYYLSMPFVILGKFDPLSPIFGTVLGGMITAIGLLILSRKLNPPGSLILIELISLGWFPLLQSSRSGLWAWHVSYIPMWLTLGALLYLRGSKLSMALAGFFLGLTIHHHYISVFAITAFSVAATVDNIKQRKLLSILLFFMGMIMAIIPFVIFDLRHSPGLFLTRMLYGSPVVSQFSVGGALQKLTRQTVEMTVFFTQSKMAAVILGVTAVVLLLWDLKNKSEAMLWSAGWIGQLMGLIFIQNDSVSVHYILPAVIFFLIWLIVPRKGLGKYLSTIVLLILTVSSVFSIKPQLIRKNWQTDIPSVRLLTDAIKGEILTKDLINNNLAVLGSPDNNVYGRRYRDVLLVRDVRLKSKDEYQYSDHLFVISTANENTVRSDKAYEMHFFRNGKLLNTWSWPNTEWNLYLFSRNLH